MWMGAGVRADEADPALLALAVAALDLGVDDAREGVLIPSLLVEAPEGRRLQRYIADCLEDGVAAARAAVREQRPQLAALVYDGYVTFEGERLDAVVVEAGRPELGDSLVLAQRYRPWRGLHRFDVIGDVADCGPAPSLFA